MLCCLCGLGQCSAFFGTTKILLRHVEGLKRDDENEPLLAGEEDATAVKLWKEKLKLFIPEYEQFDEVSNKLLRELPLILTIYPASFSLFILLGLTHDFAR